MTRKIASVLLLTALSASLSAQIVFQRTYRAGPETNCTEAVLQTADGGYIFTGFTAWRLNICWDAWLVRTDAYGDTLWTRKYGVIEGFDGGCALLETEDSGFAMAGFFDPMESGDRDAWLVRLDAGGDTVWSRTYGGSGTDVAYDVEQLEDGGYVVAGRTQSIGAGRNDFYLVRTDTEGDVLWLRAYGGSDDDFCEEAVATSDRGFVLAGATASAGAGGFDFWLVKTDSVGDTLWTRTYGGEGLDFARSVRQTPDGGYILVGETSSFGAGESDVWLVRTDAGGDTLWTRTFGGDSIEQGTCVAGTNDGGYVVCGIAASFGVGGEAYLIKTDAAGRAAIGESRPVVVPEAPSAPTVLGLAELLEELRCSPGSALFDASGRALVSPQRGVVFLRRPGAARKVILAR